MKFTFNSLPQLFYSVLRISESGTRDKFENYRFNFKSFANVCNKVGINEDSSKWYSPKQKRKRVRVRLFHLDPSTGSSVSRLFTIVKSLHFKKQLVPVKEVSFDNFPKRQARIYKKNIYFHLLFFKFEIFANAIKTPGEHLGNDDRTIQRRENTVL